MKIGIGYDIHRLETGRKLILGGIEIPFDKGAVGHSDADVLIHALIDAMLGASGKGDIGKHFPDTDPQWKGANSVTLLKKTHGLLLADFFKITNIDCTIILEKPKLADYIPIMKINLAKILFMSERSINIKAKTNEGLDSIGHGEAIAAQAIILID